MNKLLLILSQRRYLVTALVALVAYAFLYLAAAQLLLWQGSAESSASAVSISADWRALLFRKRAPFLYEPIGVVVLGQRLRLYLAVPNVAIALFLGVLVGLNAAVSYHGFRALAFRGARGIASLLGTIPALVGGAACCVPALDTGDRAADVGDADRRRARIVLLYPLVLLGAGSVAALFVERRLGIVFTVISVLLAIASFPSLVS